MMILEYAAAYDRAGLTPPPVYLNAQELDEVMSNAGLVVAIPGPGDWVGTLYGVDIMRAHE